MGVSKHTIYAWKQKYGGLEVAEAQELKQLRDENARLKRLVADLSLEKDALQFVIRKNRAGFGFSRARRIPSQSNTGTTIPFSLWL